MDPSLLSDPDVYPSDEVLAEHLGRAKAAFDLFLSINQESGFEATWKYYRDGKSWLMNVSNKKKTVAWVKAEKGWFRTTFYLGGVAEPKIMACNIPQQSKDQYKAAEGKKIRGVSLEIRSKKDLDGYRELVKIKLGA